MGSKIPPKKREVVCWEWSAAWTLDCTFLIKGLAFFEEIHITCLSVSALNICVHPIIYRHLQKQSHVILREVALTVLWTTHS